MFWKLIQIHSSKRPGYKSTTFTYLLQTLEIYFFFLAECSKSCLNGGRCISTDLCSCPEGFGGSQCETNLQTRKFSRLS